MCQLRRMMREHGPEDAGEESAIGEEEIEVFIDVGLAGADANEGAIDGDENDDVDDGDGEEKERGDESADEAADGAGCVHVDAGGRARRRR